MRQVWITKAGGPEVLEVREGPDPEPKEREVRIRVEAAGVNFADILGRMGMYPDLPDIPIVVGYEVAGRADKVGPGASESWVGKDVLALCRFGGYSDVVCVPEVQVTQRPAGMDARTGAAVPVAYLTAWQLMVVMGGLKKGESVLIHSAGGGVGIAAIQIAQHIGARVIGTASRGKHEYLTSIGARELIDYRTEDFEKRVGEMTGGQGVALVLDAVGGSSYKKSFRCLSATGRLGMFGMSEAATGKKRSLTGLVRFALNMPWLTFNPAALMNQNKGVFGVNLGHMWGEPERIRGWLGELMDLYEQGAIKPKIDRAFSFADAASAHHYIQDRKNIGKVILEP